jgi:hypothetical protein
VRRASSTCDTILWEAKRPPEGPGQPPFGLLRRLNPTAARFSAIIWSSRYHIWGNTRFWYGILSWRWVFTTGGWKSSWGISGFCENLL